MEPDALAEIRRLAGTRTVDARVLSGQGLLVTLSIRRWRASKTMGYDDLGILPPEDAATRKALQDCLQLGRKRLLPRVFNRQLNAVEGAARSHLTALAVKTPWGAFVPYTAYLAWKRGNAEYEAQFWGLCDALLRDLDQHIATILRDYAQAAAHAYTTLIAVHPEVREQYPTRTYYVDQFCARIRGLIPTPEAIRASFAYTVKLDQITFAGQVEVPATAEAPALQTMRQDLDRALRQRAGAELDAFLNATMSQVRSLLYDVSSSVLTSIQRRGNVTNTAATRLHALVEQVRHLNFTDDREVAAMTEQIQRWLGTPAKARDAQDLTDRLSDIATLCRAELIDLGHSPRAARALPDADAALPLDRAKRFARYTLGITSEPEGLDDLLLTRRRGRGNVVEQLAMLSDPAEVVQARR